MDKQTSKEEFQQDYNPVGIIRPKGMVDYVPENKHGVDNPVVDLKVGSDNAVLAPIPLTPTRVPFANSSGQLVDDAGFTFVSGTLTVTNLSTGTTIGGAYIYRAGGTDVSLADGGTGASLADPNTDAILFWDDSAGAVTFLTVGTGLQISGTVLSSIVTQYTDEQAQDAVGGILVSTDTITLMYNDGTPSITADVRTQMSITSDASGIKLSGDETTPGNLEYYGTDAGGTKGFFPIAESVVTLLSSTNLPLDADADTDLFTVPIGKNCVLSHAVLVVGADAGTTLLSIGRDGVETDFIDTYNLSVLDLADDAAILSPVPNSTPALIKSYPATTVIQAQVSSNAGGATNQIFLFGFLY